MIRAFSTSAAAAFKKESVTQFSNVARAAAPPKKSFAEYRLKVVNQSPLKLRSKAKKV
ncbi:hypothetical protein CAJCM15448_14200 [Candidozyma auris]|nr:hypothetical protein CAJCM15448_14200 [[Candida] auris]